MAPSAPEPDLHQATTLVSTYLPSGTLTYKLPALVVILLILYVVASEAQIYLSRIPHLPGPRGYPIVGSLPALWGKVHAEQFRLWSEKYGDVFQVRLGERTAVVVNSASAARNLFLGQREAMNSRPLFYVLHGKVQGNSPVTSIGTSPWNESCKRRRKVGATAMNKVAVSSYQPVSRSCSNSHYANADRMCSNRSSTLSRGDFCWIFSTPRAKAQTTQSTFATPCGNMP